MAPGWSEHVGVQSLQAKKQALRGCIQGGLEPQGAAVGAAEREGAGPGNREHPLTEHPTTTTPTKRRQRQRQQRNSGNRRWGLK